MIVPERIVRRRRRGWKLPPGGICVTARTRWENPFRPVVKSLETNTEAVRLFRHEHVPMKLAADPGWIVPLLGATALACYCRLDWPCHSDVILELIEELIRRAG